ncbi:MAG TPA: lipopolysaccharide kinase InaA family protein [Longimicrobiaceae bacterium]|nr:lipopolysaccharide kinase InaA family protein [Longimicrobiaceae bacterium]
MDFHDYSAHPELSDFLPIEGEGGRMLVRRGYQLWAGVLGGGGDAGGGATVSGGRVDHPVVTLPNGERAVVRQYRRGGMVRHLNSGRYFVGHRAFAELRATERARVGGARVPLVLAASEQPAGFGYSASLATLWIPDSSGLSDWLRAATREGRRVVMGAVGREIARMHAAGVAHPDLNLNNVLVAGGFGSPPLVHLLDFDKARLYRGAAPSNRRARDLERFARSARKLSAPIDAKGWAELCAGYGDDWPLSGPLG